MPKKVTLNQNFSTENVLVETDQNIKDLYEAMVAKFGENNVTIEGEGDTKKLIVIDGEKKLAFSASGVPEAEQATENNDSISTAGLVQEVAPEETTTTEDVNADLADEQLDKLADAEKELGEVNAQIAETEDFSQLNVLREKRNALEDQIINCSKYLNNCGKQYNFSSDEGNMKYYTENGINFSEDNKVIGFSYCDKDYFFSDETEDTITIVDVDGNPTVLNKADVVAAMQNQGVDPATTELENAEAEADAIEDAENIKANESCKCDNSHFDDGMANNEGQADMNIITDTSNMKNPLLNPSARKRNNSEDAEAQSEVPVEATAETAAQAPVPFGQPIDVDSENPYDVDPELFYVIGLKDNGTEATDDDEIDVEIGVGFLTEEEATAAANEVTPEENETIVVMKGAELIDKYDEMFDAMADAEMATDQNMSEMACDPATGECVAVKADSATVPVVVNDVNNLAVTDLECGDKCISPFGNECVITKNVEPDDEIVQVSIPDDGVVVEVPVEDFSRDFSVIVSAKTLVNFSNQIRQEMVQQDHTKNFDENSETASTDAEEVADESDSFVPVEDEVVEENVEKTESEKTEAEKDADDEKNADEGAKPATVSEVEAIVEEQIENKKPEIVTEAATKTVEAIAPALQSQSQGMPAEEPAPEGAPAEAPAEAPVEGGEQPQGEQPVEGEGGESGEQVNQSEMVNHSEFFQNSAPQKQVNFSNDYARNLAGCFKRGKQAS